MKKSVILGVAFLFISGAAFAHHKGNHEGACKADVEKFCKDVKPGGGAILKCLNEHSSELSTECKERKMAMKEHVEKFMEVCKDDLNKYCSKTPRGEGKKLKCLNKNEANLAPACKDEVTAMKAKHEEWKEKRHEMKEEESEEKK